MKCKYRMPYISILIIMLFTLMACQSNETTPSENELHNEYLTPSFVLENRDSLIDSVITVEGTAIAVRVVCTKMGCFESNPCCNACSGKLFIKDKHDSVSISGTYEEKDVGCSGTNCEIECYPLKQGKKYRVTGRWETTPQGDYTLNIESFE